MFLPAAVRTKTVTRQGNSMFKVATASMQGFRASMEDAHCVKLGMSGTTSNDDSRSFFAIFDGHGGAQCSKWCSENLVKFLEDIAENIEVEGGVNSSSSSSTLLEADIRSACYRADAAFKHASFASRRKYVDDTVTVMKNRRSRANRLHKFRLDEMRRSRESRKVYNPLLDDYDEEFNLSFNNRSHSKNTDDITTSSSSSSSSSLDLSFISLNSLLPSTIDELAPTSSSASDIDELIKSFPLPPASNDFDTQSSSGSTAVFIIADYVKQQEVSSSSSFQSVTSEYPAPREVWDYYAYSQQRQRGSANLIIGNIGDSRAIIVRGGSDGEALLSGEEYYVESLTNDHKPLDTQEYCRIYSSGSFIANGRVNGQLSLSRAFGDFDFKGKNTLSPSEQAVVCTPDFRRCQLKQSDFLLLFCDGINESMTNDDAANFVYNAMSDNPDADPAIILCNLIDTALRRGSMDNISVMIVIPQDGTDYATKFKPFEEIYPNVQ